VIELWDRVSSLFLLVLSFEEAITSKSRVANETSHAVELAMCCPTLLDHTWRWLNGKTHSQMQTRR